MYLRKLDGHPYPLLFWTFLKTSIWNGGKGR
jgi:hypothetical protein